MTKALTQKFSVSFLFGGALTSAVFFQGFHTEFLCFTLTLLVLWGLWVTWANYGSGFSLPKTGVALCITLYWIWLGVSAAWGRVAYLGTINFWWLGSLPLVFWVYVLSPWRDEVWRYGFRWAVIIGVALAVAASGQWLIYGLEPTATFLNRHALAALLNLTAIPLAGYFLLDTEVSRKWRRWVLGATLFVLVFGFTLIEGRGATLSGAIAFLMLVVVAWRLGSKRFVIQLVALVSSAFLIASQLGHLGIGQRMEAMVRSPHEAGAGRFAIWTQSWEMLQDAPWMGVGLGHYALYWPPYRHPIDGSGGFFVHNDYLQIWIEAGLPGLLLLVAVLASVFFTYVRAMRTREISSSRKIEMTALFAGLLAVAMHSFVDFNLYILSILVLAGLVLGRLHVLAFSARPEATFSLAPSRLVSQRGYRILSVLIAALALLYFATLGLASFEYRKGLGLAGVARWEEAYSALDRAARFYPYADNMLMSKADLLRHLISVLPESSREQKQAMFSEAQKLLARAEDLNPLRPQIFATRGLLYDSNPELVGPDWVEQSARNYRRAIELEPRAYQARYLFATFLLKQNRLDAARLVLEDGMRYVYSYTVLIVPYYALTAKLRADAGDGEGASVLRHRIDDIKRTARARASIQN